PPRAPADADREPRSRVDAGGRAPGTRQVPLLRAQAGQEAPLLHRQLQGLPGLRERARLRRAVIVALLGDPVSSSLSPPMQNAAFAARGLDWTYVALRVRADELEPALRGLVALGFAGANVTTPHKLAVAKLVDAEVESVNTLVVSDGRVQGSSTDAAILGGLEFERAAILGDGGAAVAFAEELPDALRFS